MTERCPISNPRSWKGICKQCVQSAQRQWDGTLPLGNGGLVWVPTSLPGIISRVLSDLQDHGRAMRGGTKSWHISCGIVRHYYPRTITIVRGIVPQIGQVNDSSKQLPFLKRGACDHSTLLWYKMRKKVPPSVYVRHHRSVQINSRSHQRCKSTSKQAARSASDKDPSAGGSKQKLLATISYPSLLKISWDQEEQEDAFADRPAMSFVFVCWHINVDKLISEMQISWVGRWTIKSRRMLAMLWHAGVHLSSFCQWYLFLKKFANDIMEDASHHCMSWPFRVSCHKPVPSQVRSWSRVRKRKLEQGREREMELESWTYYLPHDSPMYYLPPPWPPSYMCALHTLHFNSWIGPYFAFLTKCMLAGHWDI